MAKRKKKSKQKPEMKSQTHSQQHRNSFFGVTLAVAGCSTFVTAGFVNLFVASLFFSFEI
jgi:hypothetical protein